MSRKILLALAGVATAAALAPLPSASAVCMFDLSSVGGPSCFTPCPGSVYGIADRAVKDRLPNASVGDCMA